MNLQGAIRKCLEMPGAEETWPFGPEVRVYKVGGKMFALINADESSINLKNTPSDNELLRVTVEGIKPGYHMNKRHWNTIDLKVVDDGLTAQLIEDSYRLVFDALTKKKKEEIADA
jgi:predicted DNA-binding protein (MmcQ/YjbR family)